MSSLLEARDLGVMVDGVPALKNVDLSISQGDRVAVLGAGGSGKTALVRAIAGLEHTTGTLTFNGADLRAVPAHGRAKLLISVIAGAPVLPSLTVEEHLRMCARGGRKGNWNRKQIFALFPALRRRFGDLAGELKSGERWALALACAAVANPVLIVVDELSSTTRSMVVDDLYASLSTIVTQSGAALLLAEQEPARLAGMVDRAHELRNGVLSEPVAVAAGLDLRVGPEAAEPEQRGSRSFRGSKGPTDPRSIGGRR